MGTASHQPKTSRIPRIAIGGIMHETHSFAPGTTALDAFEARVLLRGQEVIAAGAGTDSALGGVIAAAERRAEIAPTVFASAMPGPPVTSETFELLAGELLQRLRQEMRRWPGLDGVVLLLHGAMITTSLDDPEGELIERVRDLIGPDRPVVAVLDFHATVTPRMVATADALIAYQTYPHLDARARGEEALALCLALRRGECTLTVAHRRVPLLMPLLAQSTEPGEPLSPLIAAAEAWRAYAQVVSISITPGFPYGDVPHAGASVLVYTRGDPDLAACIADDLVRTWWSARSAFPRCGQPPESLLDIDAPGPIVVADIADNPGAGAGADSTHLIRFFLEHGLGPAAFAVIADPEAVAACHEAELGASIDLAIGGKGGSIGGEPVRERWRIEHLGDGVYANRGPMAHGSINRIGRTATVGAHGISAILSERRSQALDPAVFHANGVDPESCRWLVVKSSVHYRAAFRSLAVRMIEIETPGLCSSSIDAHHYHNVHRPIWPLDDPAARRSAWPGLDGARA